MARDKLTEYSATASENTVCGDVNIAENSALPSDMNNFAREVMSHLKAFSDGTDAIDALTVTGDLTVDTNTLHVDATNNRVGIGTVSPSQTVEISNDGNAGLDIVDSGSGDPAIRLSVANSAGYVGTTTNHSLRFIANDSEVGRFLSGGGLTFNGDTAAANALDDYEEGTWTPADASSAGLTLGLTGSQARYTKIGKVLLIHADITIPGTSSSEAVSINGLPFNTEQYGNGFIGWSDSNTNPNIHVSQTSGELQISFRKSDGSGDHVYGDVSSKRFMFGAIIFVS